MELGDDANGEPVLEEMQSLLESVYRVELDVRVTDFVIGTREREVLCAQGAEPSSASEQLFVLHDDDGEGASLALFIDDEVLARTRESEPLHALGPHNLSDFCLLAEGVSHFVYLAWKATRGEPVTQLELELQAEVDKYVACSIASCAQENTRFRDALKASLFQHVDFRADLTPDESERYRTANRLALRYCEYLERSYLRGGGLQPAMGELRRFYRMTQPSKLDHIAARLAA